MSIISYIQCLETQIRLSSGRKQYAAAISYLKNSGYTQAAGMRRWRTAYPRRRNMLDELVKAGY